MDRRARLYLGLVCQRWIAVSVILLLFRAHFGKLVPRVFVPRNRMVSNDERRFDL